MSESEQATAEQPLKVALLGCGVVGSSVARMLTQHSDDLAARVGRPLELIGIAVRRAGKDRSDLPVDPALFTTDAESIITEADIVIEVIGGIEPARTLIELAMKSGASVVSANKALLAEAGPALYAAAAEHGVDLYYEAAVAGAIPILRPIRESLAGDDIRKVLGIVNGTTNYVLDKMDSTGMGFAEAVEQAQALGYAEADPTADVEGFDAAAKAAILASLAFHTRVSSDQVYREGITEVSAADVQAAREMDCVVKLLAICERTEVVGSDGTLAPGVSVRVHPAMIPRSHPLGGVRDAFNAVFVEAEAAGELMFYGKGAGGDPTASAVLGDVVAVARHRVGGGRGPGESAYADLPVLEMGQALTRYHISLDVADRPGVLAQVATSFAEHGVSIETVRQQIIAADPDGPDAESRETSANLIVVTHTAPDAALAATVQALAALDTVRDVVSVMRVEGA
ncbi:homoserine dehydrogenase [Pedococcus bigeumensis]|uniref:Homoserine dehydrogenase n=1 Tax=Pedococcus bigeumensis TaxID=433644 RepID=A0A502CX79_9MICO|nr:homoserine dehydrogenase [Pedococcus bigeumensis]TPG16351.1 homoserine dehydrogenase [Pedococcus bigeumensis]